MTCGAKGCTRETEDESATLCSVCCIELEVLMRAELTKKMGRAPSETEFDIFIDRLLAHAVDPKRKPQPANDETET